MQYADLFDSLPVASISYGTAGFRSDATLMPRAALGSGAVAAAMSRMNRGQTTGMVMTASHNPAKDNGVKLVGPDGGMISMAFEEVSSRIVNAESGEESEKIVSELIGDHDGTSSSKVANVFVARDTRTSGPYLCGLAIEGICSFEGKAVDLGLLTTPQLHWAVHRINRGLPWSEEAYFQTLAENFEILVSEANLEADLLVDCANGVGALKLKRIAEDCKIKIEICNAGTDGMLNFQCGADFVQKEKKLPVGVCQETIKGRKIASLDGDADRLVYLTSSGTDKIDLYDGDKIAALFSLYIQDIISRLQKCGHLLDIDVAVIQTAYANGSSSKYIRDVAGLNVHCTPTGVKHLHAEAIKHDISIYFEANGHGTIYFGEDLQRRLTALQSQLDEQSDAANALTDLTATVKLVNQAVGDAFSNLLLIEAILARKSISMAQWMGLYRDLPSKQSKVQVPDRRKGKREEEKKRRVFEKSKQIKTYDAERKVSEPGSLQERIEAIISDVDPANGRAFVRPSGTEDVVRVYSEATTQDMADALAEKIADATLKALSGQSH